MRDTLRFVERLCRRFSFDECTDPELSHCCAACRAEYRDYIAHHGERTTTVVDPITYPKSVVDVLRRVFKISSPSTALVGTAKTAIEVVYGDANVVLVRVNIDNDNSTDVDTVLDLQMSSRIKFVHMENIVPMTIVIVGICSITLLYLAVTIGAHIQRQAALNVDIVSSGGINAPRAAMKYFRSIQSSSELSSSYGRDNVDNGNRPTKYRRSLVMIKAQALMLSLGIVMIGLLLTALPVFIVSTIVLESEHYLRCQPKLVVLGSWAFVLMLCAVDFVLRITPRLGTTIERTVRCRRLAELADTAGKQALVDNRRTKICTGPTKLKPGYRSTTEKMTTNERKLAKYNFNAKIRDDDNDIASNDSTPPSYSKVNGETKRPDGGR